MSAAITKFDRSQRDMISRASLGDQETFRQLYTQFSPYAYAILRRMMGDSPHVDDVLQQVFVKVYQELPEFKGERPFRSWLGRACCLSVYDHLRRERRHEAVPFEEGEGAANEASAAVGGASDAGPERAYVTAEIHRRTQALLDLLTPEKRMAVIMCDFEGYTLKEAAEIIGVAKFTLRTRLVRARKELAKLAAKDERLSQLLDAGERS